MGHGRFQCLAQVTCDLTCWNNLSFQEANVASYRAHTLRCTLELVMEVLPQSLFKMYGDHLWSILCLVEVPHRGSGERWEQHTLATVIGSDTVWLWVLVGVKKYWAHQSTPTSYAQARYIWPPSLYSQWSYKVKFYYPFCTHKIQKIYKKLNNLLPQTTYRYLLFMLSASSV